MQNEACIKQGSEKESFRQQLIDAKEKISVFFHSPELDAEEKEAINTIFRAADEQRMSPKAFVKAVEAIVTLDDAKMNVLRCGYSVLEFNEHEEAQDLFTLVTKYQIARAVVLGFKKSLSPSGWDILED